MPAKTNLIKQSDITVMAREVDFVSRFTQNWDSLREIMGIMRPIEKQPGTVLKSYTAELTLEDGDVGEGEEIPYSHATVKPVSYADITIKKYAKAVSIEAVTKYGAAVAVQKTDQAFLNELQGEVLDSFYDFLQTGTLTSTQTSFQKAIAMAIGMVTDKFKKMRKDSSEIIVFVNTLDYYNYLGTAEISTQTQAGMTYIKNFMGASTVILSSEIPEGQIIATPSENIDLYYVDPSNSDFAQLGLSYTTQGETNLIGFHASGNYNTAVGESFAIMGMTLWAEYLDGIAVVSFGDAGSTIGTLTVSSAAGTTSGTTKLTVTPAKGSGNSYKYKVGDAAVNVVGGQNVQTWTAWDGTSDITAATGKTVTVVECDGSYKAKSAGSATVTAKA